MAERLGDESVDAFHFIKGGIAAELCSTRPWVFVSPTYGWQIPRIFADFIRAGSFEGSKKAYFVMSCGSEIGNAEATIAKLCDDKSFEYQGVLEVVMPENYVAMFSVPGNAEAERIVAAARPSLEMGADCIQNGNSFPKNKVGVVDKMKSGFVNSLFYTFFVKAKAFYTLDTCIGCGKCERVCPMNNVHIKDGKPVWGDNCTHCMACICGCPSEAVEYGKQSLGKPRYQCAEYKP